VIALDIKAVIFDMDGTLTVPTIDFYKMREDLGMPGEQDIVDYISSRPLPEQRRLWDVIEKHEKDSELVIKDGVEECLRAFKDNGIFLGLLTRNSKKSVDKFLARSGFDFDLILTREHDFVKPDPAAVRFFLERWLVEPGETMMVGDYIHDILCAKNASALSCFFYNPGAEFFGHDADFIVNSFQELRELVLS
jgi:phosphoglycolate phosphatase-like HAD superfamily hydrolase